LAVGLAVAGTPGFAFARPARLRSAPLRLALVAAPGAVALASGAVVAAALHAVFLAPVAGGLIAGPLLVVAGAEAALTVPGLAAAAAARARFPFLFTPPG